MGDPAAWRAPAPCLLIACSPDCEEIIAAINFLSFSAAAIGGVLQASPASGSTGNSTADGAACSAERGSRAVAGSSAPAPGCSEGEGMWS